MFEDDIVICADSKGKVEEHLERWSYSIPWKGRGVKNDYVCEVTGSKNKEGGGF